MSCYNQTIDEIEKMGEMALIPVGSLEQHGHHLPINTDVVITQAYGDMLGERLGAFVLPCLPISTNREHMGKKGSVWMKPDTFYTMLGDIIMSLSEQGFKKIVVVQGHGGVFVIPPLIRQLNATLNPEVQVCKLELFNFFEAYRKEGILESPHIMHADELETSVMLHLVPQYVHMEKAVDFVPKEPREYLNYASLLSLCPDGVWGEPSSATAEKGKRILELGTKLGEAYVKEVFDLIKNKRPYGYSRF
ncbi:creatininase family protein [Oscillospiraceae bacterium MB08-C2-2]|nr:creatininase family protein [Oscillospiraceae bacterium MB08-C2-2]